MSLSRHPHPAVPTRVREIHMRCTPCRTRKSDEVCQACGTGTGGSGAGDDSGGGGGAIGSSGYRPGAGGASSGRGGGSGRSGGDGSWKFGGIAPPLGNGDVTLTRARVV